MNARLIAEKNILKRKLRAEDVAEHNLNKVLADENVKVLFMKCKKLVVEVAKLEVDGLDASKERAEYNETRMLLAELLKELGVDKSDLKPKFTCVNCKDTGYVKGKMCECLKKEISLELIKQSGIDVASMARFSDDYSIFDKGLKSKIKVIYDKMKQFVDKLDTTSFDNVIILGNTGVGKTHLIECMATYAIESGRQIKYTTAFNFNQDMLKFHCAKLNEKSELMEPYLKSDILFLDDLGTENKINNVTDEYLFSVISERMQNHRKTVITTNLDLGQIQDVYGERIFSRLMHKKQSLKFNFEGSDLRLKK